MLCPPNSLPLYQRSELKVFLEWESESMEFEAYNERYIQILRANVAVLIAEHSKNSNLDAYIQYVAMISFDRFISRYELPTLRRESDEYRVRVIALSCLAFAWKRKKALYDTNGYMNNIPNLDIDERDVYKVEILISKAFPWFLHVDALLFLPYFMSLVEDAVSSDRSRLKSNVKELIVQSQRDINFTLFKPSVIAASAILCLLGPSSGNMQKFTGEYVKLDLNKVADCVRMMTEFRNKRSEAKVSSLFWIEEEDDKMNFGLNWTNDEKQDLKIDPLKLKLTGVLMKLVCCKGMD